MDARARSLAPVLGADADLLEANAWLHDIGYAPGLAVTGLHALDGARYLRDAQHADAMLCRLVAHHSCAIIEAGERVGSIQHREGPGPHTSHAAPGQILLAAAGDVRRAAQSGSPSPTLETTGPRPRMPSWACESGSGSR